MQPRPHLLELCLLLCSGCAHAGPKPPAAGATEPGPVTTAGRVLTIGGLASAAVGGLFVGVGRLQDPSGTDDFATRQDYDDAATRSQVLTGIGIGAFGLAAVGLAVGIPLLVVGDEPAD